MNLLPTHLLPALVILTAMQDSVTQSTFMAPYDTLSACTYQKINEDRPYEGASAPEMKTLGTTITIEQYQANVRLYSARFKLIRGVTVVTINSIPAPPGEHSYAEQIITIARDCWKSLRPVVAPENQ